MPQSWMLSSGSIAALISATESTVPSSAKSWKIHDIRKRSSNTAGSNTAADHITVTKAALARAIALWQPYRCWDDLLLVSEIDEIVIDQLRQGGFEIGKPNDAAWVVPKPFKLSAA